MKPASALTCTLLLLTALGAVPKPRSERQALHTLAPAKYRLLANPFSADEEARALGERIYIARCAKCHEPGDEGEREGPQLDTPEISAASAGTLYWVLEKGDQRRGMPSFAKLPEKYRWQVVTFLQRRCSSRGYAVSTADR